MTPAIEVKDVSFSYEEMPILEKISFTINPNEFVAIIGPNGGGKTTLLRLLMGFLQPTFGTISLFGHSPRQQERLIAYVPQTLRFDRQFPISVFELVLSGRLSHLPWYGWYRQHDKKLALAALERVGLADFSHAPFGTLSGGQTQRALIARALASDPKLLLLDEPTANVDSQAEHDIYELLATLRHQMTIVMVTHDLTAAIERVDRVLCIHRNVVALQPEQVCEHYAMGLYHPPLLRVGGSK